MSKSVILVRLRLLRLLPVEAAAEARALVRKRQHRHEKAAHARRRMPQSARKLIAQESERVLRLRCPRSIRDCERVSE